LVREVVVLMPRFLRLRAFLAGVVGRCSSKKLGAESVGASVLRARKSAANEELSLAMGDSGEGPGEGSVTEDESIVEIVVVGELSDDVVELLSRLSWGMWNEEKGAACVVGGATLLPWALEQLRLGRECRSAPKTEPNEGMGEKVREVVAGMLCAGRKEGGREGAARMPDPRRRRGKRERG
jgi:hypothetical protein